LNQEALFAESDWTRQGAIEPGAPDELTSGERHGMQVAIGIDGPGRSGVDRKPGDVTQEEALLAPEQVARLEVEGQDAVAAVGRDQKA
jgi:hypothetical protein